MDIISEKSPTASVNVAMQFFYLPEADCFDNGSELINY